MLDEPNLFLQCVRQNGRREETGLNHQTLSEARELAKGILRVGNGLYAEVEICTESGTIETVRYSAVPLNPAEVLLVEDNAGDALLVRQALADCPEPVHLRLARDGPQALRILQEPDFTPDLVILDLNIPGISGYTVLAAHQLQKTPVVVFSAWQNETDRGRALALGARDFVHKPLNIEDYKSAVTGMVQRWAGNDRAVEPRPS